MQCSSLFNNFEFILLNFVIAHQPLMELCDDLRDRGLNIANFRLTLKTFHFQQ